MKKVTCHPMASTVMLVFRLRELVLMVKDPANGLWSFPSESFRSEINGRLDDTLKRLFMQVKDGALKGSGLDIACFSSIEQIGAYMVRRGNVVSALYGFLTEQTGSSEGLLTRPEMSCVKGQSHSHIWARLEIASPGPISLNGRPADITKEAEALIRSGKVIPKK